jgi:hypothetical protein
MSSHHNDHITLAAMKSCRIIIFRDYFDRTLTGAGFDRGGEEGVELRPHRRHVFSSQFFLAQDSRTSDDHLTQTSSRLLGVGNLGKNSAAFGQ